MGVNREDEEELDSLLSAFDDIYDGFKDGITQIQTLQLNCNAEIKKRQALQFSFDSLKSENERLAKLYTGSLSKFTDEIRLGAEVLLMVVEERSLWNQRDSLKGRLTLEYAEKDNELKHEPFQFYSFYLYELECRTNCQSLKEELKRMSDDHIKKENELIKAVESLKKDYEARTADMETQIRCFQIEKAGNEATINQLRQDLASHRNHIEALASRLERVKFDVESRYEIEIRDLKDCLSIEQEEKNELNKKLQRIEKELLISRTKVVEQQRDTSTSRNVEILKQKIMKLRKENELLKRRHTMLVPKEER